MNGDLNNGDVSYGSVFINSHTLSQCNEWIPFNGMGEYVENCDVSGRNFLMNSHNLYKAKKPSYLDYTKKKDGNVPNVSKIEDTGLQDGADIDAIFLHPHFIKITVWSATMNKIYSWLMVQCHHGYFFWPYINKVKYCLIICLNSFTTSNV